MVLPYPLFPLWPDMPVWHLAFVMAAFCSWFLLRGIGAKHLTNLSPRTLDWLFTVGYLGVYLGGRLGGILTAEPLCTSGLVTFFECLVRPGAMVSFGGFVGAYLFLGAFILKNRLPWWPLADVLGPVGLVAVGVGRVGCFLNADDYGIPSPWLGISGSYFSVVFMSHPVPIERVPVQLIETLGCFGFATAIVFQIHRIKALAGDGLVGSLCLWFYCLFRFLNEYLRGDPRPFYRLGHLLLSQGQILSALILIMSLGLYSFRALSKRAVSIEVRGADERT